MRYYTIYILMIINALAMTSCNSTQQPQLSTELNKLLNVDSQSTYRMDSIKMNIGKNGICQVDNYGIISLHDSSTCEALYVPLLISPTPVSFLKFPSLFDSAWQSELLTVQTATGNYFYIAGISGPSHCPLRDSLRIFPFHINYWVNNSSSKDRQFRLPMGTAESHTHFWISTSSGQKLKNYGIYTLNEKNEPGESENARLIPLDLEKDPIQNTSIAGAQFEPASIISLSTDTISIHPYNFKYLYVAAFIFLATLCSTYFNEQIRKQRNRYMVEKQPFKIRRAPLMRRLERGIYIFLAEQFGLGISLRRHNQLDYDYIQSRKIWILFIYVLWFLIALFIASLGFAQSYRPSRSGSPIVENLEMGWKPALASNGSIAMKIHLKFIMASVEKRKRLDTIAVFYDSLHADLEKSDPENLPGGGQMFTEFMVDNNTQWYQTVISSGSRKIIDPLMLRLLLKSNERILTIKSSRKNSQPYAAIQRNDQFTDLQYRDDSHAYMQRFNYHFHKFPYDFKSLETRFKFPQITSIKRISFEKVDFFELTSTTDIPLLKMTEEERQYVWENEMPVICKAWENHSISITLHRNAFLRIGIPVVLFIYLIGSTIGIFKTGKAWKFGILGIDLALPVIYKGIQEALHSTIPCILDLNGDFNIFDIFFGFILLINLLTLLLVFLKNKQIWPFK